MPTFIITIKELAPLDGEYKIPLPFTNRELHTIKRVAGVRAGEIGEAFAVKDNDLVLALACIGLERAGKTFSMDQIWDADTGLIVLDAEDDEEDKGPPGNPSPNEPGAGGGTDDDPAASGLGSSDAGGLQENDPSPIGSQD